jgi:16S rRNA (cytosine1402-N4)-methyltransferase
MENLEALLDSAPQVLKAGGRMAVISFQSLEDRLVKNNFRKNKSERIYEIITKKPLIPTRLEISENRRSRSAKLRIARKITKGD